MYDEEEPSEKKIKMEILELEDICTVEEVDVVGVDSNDGQTQWNTNNISESFSPDGRGHNTNSSDGNASMLTDFRGPCNFGYHFRRTTPSQVVFNSWLFSDLLNQVFLKMGNVVHIQFNVDDSKAPNPNDLFIRATPVYCNADHVHLPVTRCTLHSLDDDPLNESHKDGICRCNQFNQVGHIIRSTSANAVYCFDPETERHSVLVPLKHRLYDLLFSFACKSSCTRGMERRPIRTVFSLENGEGLILGRCSLNIKICSCPKRDKDRAENEFKLSGSAVKKRQIQPAPPIDRNGHNKMASDEGSPLEASLNSLENHVNGRKTGQRISKLKSDLCQVQNLVKKLNQFCSSIEATLDTLDSDI